jgi:hypothetical protein
MYIEGKEGGATELGGATEPSVANVVVGVMYFSADGEDKCKT